MKRDGFSQEQKALYGDAVLKLSIASTVDKTKSHCIKSLTAEKDLDVAAIVLVDTFQKEDAFHDSIDGSKERVNFLRASMKAVACFNQVLGCFDDDDDATKARNKTPPLGCDGMHPGIVQVSRGGGSVSHFTGLPGIRVPIFRSDRNELVGPR